MITAKAFSGKRYAVLGLARSGLATVEALLASGARVTAWDDNEGARAKAELFSCEGRSPGLDPRLRGDTEMNLGEFDSLILSPGIPLNRHPLVQRAREAGVEIIGDIELFARARPELPPHKVVGITGTNGKSTTTALVHHILQSAGVPSLMGGNIGLPILAQEPLPDGGVYVLELSSYQLDLTRSLDCDVAVLLNITPDHLDRYEDFEAYAASKARLFEMQSRDNVIVLNYDDAETRKLHDRFFVQQRTGQVFAPSAQDLVEPEIWLEPEDEWREEPSSRQEDWPSLQGPHNATNVAAALVSALALGLRVGAVAEGLRTFRGLPHRMERIRDRNGVLFVNDSKATNATAAAPALAAFPAIRWILGGQAKSDNLDECAPHFGHVRKAYTIGEAGGLFAALLKPQMAVAECGTLEVAVKAAASEAQPGETVLLSPACASFDQFKDYEARGDAFRAAVEAL